MKKTETTPEPPLTPEVQASRTAEIAVMLDEARSHLKRLKEIRARIHALGGGASIIADDTYAYTYAGTDRSYSAAASLQIK